MLRPLLCAALLLPMATSATAQSPVLLPGVAVEKVFGGGVFLEGPAAAGDGTIYFSDITNPAVTRQLGHIWRYDPRTRVASIYRSPSGQSNGLEIDRDGRLLAAEGANWGGRRITRTDLSTGRATLVAAGFNGRPFNSPNDIVSDEQGRIWFTDPRYSGPEPLEQPVLGVYRIDPDSTVHLVIADAGKPNGIAISPDQRTLYVASNDNGATGPVPAGVQLRPGRRGVLVYDLAADGSARFARVLVEWSNGGPDGIAVDVDGNVWATVARPQQPAVCVYSPEGRELGCLAVPEVPSNVAFGRGEEKDVVYITAQTGLYRARVGRTGYQLPAR